MAENLGIILVIKQMANFNPIIEKELLKLSVYEFYVNIQIKNALNVCELKYKKILEKK